MFIKDCIYRFIEVSDLCKQFIDTPEFQRLRNIKQLGLAFYVYPSAVHTRFEHSLGVMHLAGRVGDLLSVSPREKDLLQLAGLYHDIGHVATSHLLDYILEENNNPFTHEERSIFILNKVNQRLGLLSQRDVQIITKMIRGDTTDEKKPYLFEIVSNKAFGIDVDRLDYLQRDSYHTGMPMFQPDYLLKCLRIRDGRLAVLEKGRAEVEMMYENRKRLLTLVCRHKAVISTEVLMRKAIHELKLEKMFEDEGWLDLDDMSLDVMMRKDCPKLLKTIQTRSWERIPQEDTDKYKHLSCISDEDIKRKIDQVNFI